MWFLNDVIADEDAFPGAIDSTEHACFPFVVATLGLTIIAYLTAKPGGLVTMIPQMSHYKNSKVNLTTYLRPQPHGPMYLPWQPSDLNRLSTDLQKRALALEVRPTLV